MKKGTRAQKEPTCISSVVDSAMMQPAVVERKVLVEIASIMVGNVDYSPLVLLFIQYHRFMSRNYINIQATQIKNLIYGSIIED